MDYGYDSIWYIQAYKFFCWHSSVVFSPNTRTYLSMVVMKLAACVSRLDITV